MADSFTNGKRQGPSLVGPILLIAVGVVFLLNNLGLLPGNAWGVLLRLWPLALILIGIEVLVGRRSAAGSILSALLVLIVVGGVIGALVLAPDLPVFERFTRGADLRQEFVQAALGEVSEAEVNVDWNRGNNSLTALPTNSGQLIEGRLDVYGDLSFDVEVSGQRARVLLDDRITRNILFGFDFDDGGAWSVELHPDVVYDLSLDASSGRHTFNLEALQLSRLDVDGASGSIDLALPPGSYTTNIDGASGALNITLPAGAAVRIELDSGSGAFRPDASFRLVRGEEDGDGVWESPNFESAVEQIALKIDQGSGAINIRFAR